MVFNNMKVRSAAAFFSLLFLVAASSASAQVQMSTISVPSAITNPLSGFTINYTLSGSKYGAGAASAQLNFYLSPTPTGSTGVYSLYSTQIQLRGSGLGPYYPATGTQQAFVAQYTMPSNTVSALQAITAACQPQSWYILGRVDSTNIAYTTSLLGSTKQPDFFFTGGTLDPNTIQPGGTANISFQLSTTCPVNNTSRVGIYLTDANFQLISAIGTVSIPTGAGPFNFGPAGISFSPTIATGTYQIVLVADIDGAVAESNENNNSGYFTLNVTSSVRASAARDSGRLETEFALPDDFAPAAHGLEAGPSEAHFNGF